MTDFNLKNLLLVSNLHLTGLITLWGLTNYLRSFKNNIDEVDEIIYDIKIGVFIGVIKIKITERIFQNISMFGSFFVITYNCYQLIK